MQQLDALNLAAAPDGATLPDLIDGLQRTSRMVRAVMHPLTAAGYVTRSGPSHSPTWRITAAGEARRAELTRKLELRAKIVALETELRRG